MTRQKWALPLLHLMLLAVALAAGTVTIAQDAHAQANRVFEMRTYTTHEGKLDDLQARFRNHTIKFFEKHGMTNIGYWVPRDQPNTLIYILAYPSREAATASWDGFRKDESWAAARKASEANGPIVAKVQSVFMDPATYSSIK